MIRSRPTLPSRARLIAPVVLGILLAVTLPGCGSARAPASGTPPSAAGSTTPSSRPKPAQPTPAPTATTGAWSLMPKAPLSLPQTYGLVSVWTGSQMLIHGTTWTKWHSTPFTLSYEPATGTWRSLAPGPLPANYEGDDSAIWTGSQMLVFGLTSAAYNPVTNTWRPMPRNLNAALGSVRVWTGHQAIFWGGGCCGGALNTGAIYTPATGTWRSLPAAPLSPRYAVGAWTGREMVVAGGLQPGLNGDRIVADAAAYNPVTRTWRRLSSMPSGRAGGTMIWDGTEALYIAGTLRGTHAPAADGMAFNPATGRWRQLPAMEFGRTDFAAVWTGHRLLVWGGLTGNFGALVIPSHGVAYDPAADRWSALPMSPLHGRALPTAVWTGSEMIVWGGYYAASQVKDVYMPDGATYRPAAGPR